MDTRSQATIDGAITLHLNGNLTMGDNSHLIVSILLSPCLRPLSLYVSFSSLMEQSWR